MAPDSLPELSERERAAQAAHWEKMRNEQEATEFHYERTGHVRNAPGVYAAHWAGSSRRERPTGPGARSASRGEPVWESGRRTFGGVSFQGGFRRARSVGARVTFADEPQETVPGNEMTYTPWSPVGDGYGYTAACWQIPHVTHDHGHALCRRIADGLRNREYEMRRDSKGEKGEGQLQ